MSTLDPEPDVPGSFGEATAAFYRGDITSGACDVLAQAMAESK